jgi:hypothetical protein
LTRIEERSEVGQFALVHGPAQVQRLLSLTGVDQAITLATTPEELLGEP